MSVYRGPKAKVARSLSLAVTPKTAKVLDRRNFPPGQHGLNRKKSSSVFKTQMVEKQRLRFTFNVSEKQMAAAYAHATRVHGSTGEALLRLLETRLDSTVYRLGFARTIFAARQYVAHGHFMVNGRRAFVPSRQLRPGDVVSVRDRSKAHPQIVEALGTSPEVPPYLELDKTKMEGRLVTPPLREQIPVKIDEQLVVEYYSR